MKHPLHKYSFSEIKTGLEAEVAKGNVSRKDSGSLSLYTYTQQCVMDREWNDFTSSARGLVLGPDSVIKLPFFKFHNYGEITAKLPTGPFSIYHKIDGSMIVCAHYDGKWHCSTKGSFNSEQALAAQKHIEQFPIPDSVPKTWTLLFEWVAPENRIVVDYNGRRGLYVLGAYNTVTFESIGFDCYAHQHFMRWPLGGGNPWICPGYFIVGEAFYTIDQLLEICKNKDYKEIGEGFVLYWPHNDYRLKFKLESYLSIHRLVSRITPLGVWDILISGLDPAIVGREIPEEFKRDYDAIVAIFQMSAKEFVQTALFDYDTIIHKLGHDYSQKDYALEVQKLPRNIWSSLFYINSSKQARLDEQVIVDNVKKMYLKTVRPTGNVLPGWVPTSSMSRWGTPEAGE